MTDELSPAEAIKMRLGVINNDLRDAYNQVVTGEHEKSELLRKLAELEGWPEQRLSAALEGEAY